jgi:hypothetical protein
MELLWELESGGNIVFTECDGIDYAATTIQFLESSVPPFTVKTCC